MSDNIKDLPLDPNDKSNPEDLKQLSKLLNLPPPETVKKVASEFKNSVIAAVLALVIFGLPFSDTLIKKFKVGDNPTLILTLKFVIFVILFYIISKKMG